MVIGRLFFIGILAFVVSLGDASTIEQEKSKATFAIRNMKVRTVEGSFSGMEGDVTFDPSDLTNSSFNVCINAFSVDTGSKKRDEHLLKEDFFNIEKYQNICFKSNSIIKADDGFVALGELTLLDVSREVEIPFTKNGNTFSGKIELNRLDYGLGKGTSKFMVADEVSINIICVIEEE